MTPQELKNSILQLAIQGKLVEQRAEEGTGRELLEKIFAAKNAKDAKVGARVPRVPFVPYRSAKIFSNSSAPVPSSARCSTSLP